MSNLEKPTPDLETAADNGGCCCGVWMLLFFTVLTIIIVTPFAIWLSLRGISPYCSLEKLYIPVLDQNLKTSINSTSLDFTIRFKNNNKDKGIEYDQINVTFSNGPSTKNRSIIASYIVPSFYQRGMRGTTKRGGGVPVTGLDRDEAFRAISANGSVIIRVVLETRVRYSILWNTKRFTLKLGANVRVNGNGRKINRHDINFKSGTGKVGIYGGKLGIFLVSFLVFFVLV